ncbi:MAG: alpha-ketoacid dehydrogenase subunit beta [Candidatus Cyclobacteriaceae bacterium M3_2C_046]
MEAIIEQNIGSGTRILMYREALNEALLEEMQRDPTVFIMGEGIAERGGSYKVTAGLLDKFGKERVIDTPISENGFTGMGVGAALTGMRPVVEILFIDFSMLILDQIINQAAKLKFMSGGIGRVPMVLRTQGGVGNGLAAQHSQSLEAIFYHIPGLKLVMPSNPADAKGLLKTAIRSDEPVIFLEHKLLYMNKGEVPEGEFTIPLGKGDIKRAGRDVTIIAWSGMVPKALEAADLLAKDGIEAEVLDPRSLVPLDKELILQSVRKTEHVVIAQEAVRRGGVASDIASVIQEEAFDYLDAPIEIIAGKNIPTPFNLNLEKVVIPHAIDIYNAARKAAYADK